MTASYILALDQGTTSSRSILFDHDGGVVSVAQREFTQHYPAPGWVEHDAVEIWDTQLATAREVLAQAGVTAGDVAAIGITNQRETTVLWDRATGEPLHPAIVWQCRRTASICEGLVEAGLEEEVQRRTGLLIDAYFSGTKLQWLLDTIPGARARADRGELCFGTMDSWLLFKLTGRHATDYSNASRTMLFNIHDLVWDDFLLEQLKILRAVLPEVLPSSEVYGETTVLGDAIPVASLIGDQQAALFGQAAFSENMSKNTYGTGCFMLLNTGSTPVASQQGLLTTIAWGLDGAVDYALEGSVFVGGAVIQWLRDELGLIGSAAESESVAQEVEDNGGVYLVPAFVGLGAPHWEMAARGTITGLTRGSKRAHIVRAALESISFQSADVLHAMERETGAKISELRVDGGATANNFLMQHQSDVLGIPVIRGQVLETTALGAAFLAGLAVGYWSSRAEISGIWQEATRFLPNWDKSQRKREFVGWEGAIRGTKSSIS